MGAARSLAVWRDVRSSLAHKNAKQANVKEGEREGFLSLFLLSANQWEGKDESKGGEKYAL